MVCQYEHAGVTWSNGNSPIIHCICQQHTTKKTTTSTQCDSCPGPHSLSLRSSISSTAHHRSAITATIASSVPGLHHWLSISRLASVVTTLLGIALLRVTLLRITSTVLLLRV